MKSSHLLKPNKISFSHQLKQQPKIPLSQQYKQNQQQPKPKSSSRYPSSSLLQKSTLSDVYLDKIPSKKNVNIGKQNQHKNIESKQIKRQSNPKLRKASQLYMNQKLTRINKVYRNQSMHMITNYDFDDLEPFTKLNNSSMNQKQNIHKKKKTSKPLLNDLPQSSHRVLNNHSNSLVLNRSSFSDKTLLVKQKKNDYIKTNFQSCRNLLQPHNNSKINQQQKNQKVLEKRTSTVRINKPDVYLVKSRTNDNSNEESLQSIRTSVDQINNYKKDIKQSNKYKVSVSNKNGKQQPESNTKIRRSKLGWLFLVNTFYVLFNTSKSRHKNNKTAQQDKQVLAQNEKRLPSLFDLVHYLKSFEKKRHVSEEHALKQEIFQEQIDVQRVTLAEMLRYFKLVMRRGNLLTVVYRKDSVEEIDSQRTQIGFNTFGKVLFAEDSIIQMLSKEEGKKQHSGEGTKETKREIEAQKLDPVKKVQQQNESTHPGSVNKTSPSLPVPHQHHSREEDDIVETARFQNHHDNNNSNVYHNLDYTNSISKQQKSVLPMDLKSVKNKKIFSKKNNKHSYDAMMRKSNQSLFNQEQQNHSITYQNACVIKNNNQKLKQKQKDEMSNKDTSRNKTKIIQQNNNKINSHYQQNNYKRNSHDSNHNSKKNIKGNNDQNNMKNNHNLNPKSYKSYFDLMLHQNKRNKVNESRCSLEDISQILPQKSRIEEDQSLMISSFSANISIYDKNKKVQQNNPNNREVNRENKEGNLRVIDREVFDKVTFHKQQEKLLADGGLFRTCIKNRQDQIGRNESDKQKENDGDIVLEEEQQQCRLQCLKMNSSQLFLESVILSNLYHTNFNISFSEQPIEQEELNDLMYQQKQHQNNNKNFKCACNYQSQNIDNFNNYNRLQDIVAEIEGVIKEMKTIFDHHQSNQYQGQYQCVEQEFQECSSHMNLKRESKSQLLFSTISKESIKIQDLTQIQQFLTQFTDYKVYKKDHDNQLNNNDHIKCNNQGVEYFNAVKVTENNLTTRQTRNTALNIVNSNLIRQYFSHFQGIRITQAPQIIKNIEQLLSTQFKDAGCINGNKQTSNFTKQIEYIPCNRLKILNLSDNGIENMNVLVRVIGSNINSLEFLNLSHNQIQSLQPLFSLLEKEEQLEKAKISSDMNMNNNIIRRQFSELRQLHLKSNKISRIAYHSNNRKQHQLPISSNTTINTMSSKINKAQLQQQTTTNNDTLSFAFPRLELLDLRANLIELNQTPSIINIINQSPSLSIMSLKSNPILQNHTLEKHQLQHLLADRCIFQYDSLQMMSTYIKYKEITFNNDSTQGCCSLVQLQQNHHTEQSANSHLLHQANNDKHSTKRSTNTKQYQ